MSDVYRDRLRSGLRRNSLVLAILTLTALGVGLIATTQAQAAPSALASTASPTLSLSPTVSPASPFPPSGPTWVSSVVHANSVTLTWTASTPGCCPVVGYQVTYLREFNDNPQTLDVGGTVTTATIPVMAASQYDFWVRAIDSRGQSSPSSVELSVATPVSDTASDQSPPSTPTNLTASGPTGLTVNLAWSPSSDNVGVYGYDVYSFDGRFTSTLVASTGSTSYTAPLVSGTNRFYVRARDAAGNVSIASNVVFVDGSSDAPSGSPTRSASSSPALACKVTYGPGTEWAGGFIAGITITNTGTRPINGWTLVFTFGGDQQLSNWWNAAASQSGAKVTLANRTWNALIQPRGSVTLGFLGTWKTSNAVPSSFTLNGVPCTVG